MSTPLPLAVRLVTSRADRVISRELRSLRFRTVVPGGYASASLALDRPLAIQPDEIAYYGKVYIYDRRSGATVWEGRLEDPARSAGSDGQVWNLGAIGPSAHATDRTLPVVYVDTALNAFVRADNGTPGGIDNVSSDPGDASGVNQALVLQFPDGLHVNTTSRVVARYTRLMDTGQKLGRADYTWDSGMSDANFLVQGIARTDGSTASGDVARSDTSNPAGGGSSPRVIVTDWTAGRNTFELRVYRTAGGAATLPSDIYWASFRNVVVQGSRYNAAGTELLTAADYASNTVLSSQVVADLLGRVLTQYDGANASITTTSYAIDQLTYVDGVTPAQILDDLMAMDSGYYWAAWESNAAGKYRFEWSPWPTTLRYDASAVDGYVSQGSADGLFNEARVRYRDVTGVVRTVTRTASVPELTAAGLTRTMFIDLGDEPGSAADAQQAGDRALVEHSAAPNAGRLTVSRPILDLQRARWVQPWEILPGQLIRVRDILPRQDALNPSTRDAVTVFKVTAVEYDTASASAVLELDSPPRTLHQMVAENARRSSRPMRRR